MSPPNGLPLPAPSPPEDPPDLGPGQESAGTDPLAAALGRMRTCLERLFGTARPPRAEQEWMQRAFSDLAEGIGTHLLKEEVMFLPALRHLAAGRPAQVPLGLHLQGPVELLRGEHAALRGALDDFLARLNGPELGLSRADRQALQLRGAALGRALRDHVRLQEETLFPHVLAGAEAAL